MNDSDKIQVDKKLYGVNNEIYTIQSIDDEQIIIKYLKELQITYNSGNDKKTIIKEEDLYFTYKDIGIKLFFKIDDCNKPIKALYEDADYSNYTENLKNREKIEEEIEQKRIEFIESLRPNSKKITNEDRDLILSSYEDEAKSMKEEKEFFDYSQTHHISYFARMDLDTEYENDNYYERFYISKNTKPIEIEDGISLIDWRSPLGDFYYNTEKNELLRNNYFYKVLLKREFSFLPFKYWNKYIANNEFFNEGTADEFLMQILQEKRNSGKLTDIIYSIQSNQNKIIRTKTNENFIVQGCAGSGKTMILLHRLTYLKYNKLLPEYNKIKIITPGKIFNDFISELSRDLDIKEIEQISITNYYLSLNNDYSERYNIIQTLNERFGEKLRNNNGFASDERREKLKEVIDSIKDIVRRKLNRYRDYTNDEKMINENEIDSDIIKIFYSTEFLIKTQNEYKRRSDDIKKEISNFFDISENVKNNQYFELFIIKSIELIDRLLVKKAELKNRFFFNSNHKIDEINKKIEKIEQLQDRVLNDFYFSFDFYNKIIENMQMNYPTLIRGKTMRCQLLLLLFINYLHFGELINSDRLLCFDEAQDYNENEYRIIKLINKNVIFNLYGDINQSIYFKGIKDWENLKTIIDFKQYTLNENYRNTEQITNFCNKKFNYNSISMGITGKDVTYVEKNSINDIILQKINDKKRVAIIVRSMNDLENIIPINSEYSFYNTISQVKGIEFDSVIVFERNMTNSEKYIAYTRALNELYIIKESAQIDNNYI